MKIKASDLTPGTIFSVWSHVRIDHWNNKNLVGEYYEVTKTAYDSMLDEGEHNKVYFIGEPHEKNYEFKMTITNVKSILSREDFPEYYV